MLPVFLEPASRWLRSTSPAETDAAIGRDCRKVDSVRAEPASSPNVPNAGNARGEVDAAPLDVAGHYAKKPLRDNLERVPDRPRARHKILCRGA